MINMIEVIINNKTEYLIFPKDNTLYNNKKEYKIKEEQIKKILGIIVTWKHEYGNDNKLDSKEFLIIITDNNNKETTYHGKGKYPINFNELEELLNEVKNG